MPTLLPFDPVTTPRTLVLHPPLTDAELFQFCVSNDILRIERTREGVIEMNPPAGSYSSSGNLEIGYQLMAWWKTHKRGCAYDSTAGFHLADGSMLSPDAAYITAERLATVTKQDRLGFPHVCPDFIIELLSRTDRPAAAKKKMQRWIENGAQLAWLIDPYKRQVFVYQPESPMRIASGATLNGVGPVASFTLNLSEIWEYYKL